MAAPDRPTPELTSAERKDLRGKAHALKPLVQIGSAGLSDAVLAQIDEALDSHGLIKVRLQEPEDKKAAAAELAERSGAALCGLVGHTVILFRPTSDED
jgi:RNA-binding protein